MISEEQFKKMGIKISKNIKDWYKAALHPDWHYSMDFRDRLGNKFSYTIAGMYDLFNNSLYDNGKLKPKYLKMQNKLYGKNDKKK